MKTDNLSKFPLVLRNGFIQNELDFPDNTDWHYKSVLAYRVVFRDQDDYRPVDRSDLKSNAEKKTKRRGMRTDVPEYYGVSLFVDPKMLNNKKLFPKPGKKLARGYVCDINGPKFDGKDTHICWWLYDNIDLTKCEFELVNENE